MAGRFTGRVALITGGNSGIGRACALALVREGADVLITGQNVERGKQTATELNRAGPGRAIFWPADVRDATQVRSAFVELDRVFGSLDILFNNAGVNTFGAVDTLSEAEWDTCFDTNLKGVFLCSREAIPRLRARGGGVIINNASNAGLIARADDPAYCASKAGLIMLTRSMALAHAADRIRVNAVCPGPISNTRLLEEYVSRTPDPAAARQALAATAPLAAAFDRLITPEEVAGLVLYLCADEAQMMTGAIIAIDGGKSAGLPR